MDNLIQCFNQVMENDTLYPVFQAVASLEERRVIGYEAAVHGPADSLLYPPGRLRLASELSRAALPLERSAAKVSIRQFDRLNLAGHLFITFSPAFFLGPAADKLPKWQHKSGFAGGRLVARFSAYAAEQDAANMRAVTEVCRGLGLGVCLDEAAVLTLGRKELLDLAPDFVTIDPHYIRGAGENRTRQQFLERVISLAQPAAQIMARGVDNAADLFTLRRLGVDLAQGPYFGAPDSFPAISLPERLFVPESEKSVRSLAPSELVDSLTRSISHIAPTEMTGEVIRLFMRSPELQSIPVIYQDEPVGIIRREHLTSIFLTPYGRDLYGRAPILNFMDHDPLVVEYDEPIKQVSQLIIERGQAQDNQDFIITQAGRYHGVGKVVDILRSITAMQIRDASHANPLTGLPGNVRIEEEIAYLLANDHPFTACYLDLDNFKPFNDYYGYERGDDVIRLVAELVRDAIDPACDFIGHVGGDDFIALFRSPDWKARCKRILERFADRALELYNEADRLQGGILAKDRKGKEAFFELVSLSIGAVTPKHCDTYHCVAAMASEAKKEAKKQKGNSLFIDRRKQPA